jgi:hypothetical protein
MLSGALLLGQPRLIVSKPSSYEVGDRIDEQSWVLDRDLSKITLEEIISEKAEIVVLILFGGAANEIPEGPFRGKLWCQDSFDDVSVQRALVAEMKEKPVQFVAVAVPPVFSSEKYGFGEGTFLNQPQDSERYQKALKVFVEKTESQREGGFLPFEQIFYDPKARLTHDSDSGEFGPEYGPVLSWQGKLKWHRDPREYGAPTIWLLNAEGRILREPFWGNDYDSEPPQISYGFAELKEAVLAEITKGSH